VKSKFTMYLGGLLNVNVDLNVFRKFKRKLDLRDKTNFEWIHAFANFRFVYSKQR